MSATASIFGLSQERGWSLTMVTVVSLVTMFNQLAWPITKEGFVRHIRDVLCQT
ncbi:hypothetical protein [Vibrio sp. WXL210]|uniref:hypothetical protein n=1 Tax=Vibrio sp. WXL210 TaxID=3450709 RepID=UPI003EC71E22